MITKRAMFYLAGIGYAMALACVQVDVSFAEESSACGMKGAKSLRVPLELQQTSSWCWAATIRAVINYTKPSADPIEEQCMMANRKIGKEPDSGYCCKVRMTKDLIIPPTDCYVGGWPIEVLSVYDFDTLPVPIALNWQALTSEICLNRPFLYVIVRGGGTHVLIVLGYRYTESQPGQADEQLDPQKEWVEIYDPTHNNFEFVQYDEFVGDKLGGGQTYGYRHYSDYLQIHPRPHS